MGGEPAEGAAPAQGQAGGAVGSTYNLVSEIAKSIDGKTTYGGLLLGAFGILAFSSLLAIFERTMEMFGCLAFGTFALHLYYRIVTSPRGPQALAKRTYDEVYQHTQRIAPVSSRGAGG